MTIFRETTMMEYAAHSRPQITMEIKGDTKEMDAVRYFIDHYNSIGPNVNLAKCVLNATYGTGTGTLPEKLIFSGPCTILVFPNGLKSIVRCTKSEKFDREKGVMMAYLKHMLPRRKWKALTEQYHNTPKKEKAAAEALIRVDFGEGVLRYLMKLINDATHKEMIRFMDECSKLKK